MCEQKVYDYYAIIDGEEIKVDYCFTNLYGTGYCKYNEYTYHNVPSRSVVVGTKNVCNSTTNNTAIIIIAVLVIMYFVMCGIKNIILKR